MVALAGLGLTGCGGASGQAAGPGRPAPGTAWTAKLTGRGQLSVRGVAALSDGGALVVGAFDGALAAEALTSAGASDGFAAALSPSGAVVWTAALRGPGDQDLTAAAVAADGLIAVVGTSAGAAQLARGKEALAADVAGQPGAVIARLDAGGAPRWVRRIDVTDYAVPTAVAWSPDGSLLVAGYFAGVLDPRATALPATGGQDVWIARMNGPDGALAWIRRAGGPGADVPHGLAAGPDGATLVGSFQRWADFSSSTVRGADDTADPFVAHVGPDGFVWARSFPADGAGSATAACLLADGRIALAISIAGVVEIGGERVASAGDGRGLVAMLSREGEPRWARAVEESRSADGIACDAAGVTAVGESAGGDGYAQRFTLEGARAWTSAVKGPAAAIAGDGAAPLVGGGDAVTRLRGR